MLCTHSVVVLDRLHTENLRFALVLLVMLPNHVDYHQAQFLTHAVHGSWFLTLSTMATRTEISVCDSVQVFNRHGQILNSVLESRQFRYSSNHTPYIYGVVPYSAAPGDGVEVHGSFRWWRLYMSYRDDDPRELVRSVQLGPVRCVLYRLCLLERYCVWFFFFSRAIFPLSNCSVSVQLQWWRGCFLFPVCRHKLQCISICVLICYLGMMYTEQSLVSCPAA